MNFLVSLIMHRCFLPTVIIIIIIGFLFYMWEKEGIKRAIRTGILLFVMFSLSVAIVYNMTHEKNLEGKVVATEDCFIEAVL